MTSLGATLLKALDGEYHDVKQHCRTSISPEWVTRPPGQTLREARDWTRKNLFALEEVKLQRIGMPDGIGDGRPLSHSIPAFEILAMGDLSLTVKFGVQQGLFGGALMNLGNQDQVEKYLPQVISLELLGCYGMTEMGQGSDVQRLETTITYVPDSDEFEVHTPSESARKAYIGNAAEDGKVAAVFGRLLVDDSDHGVHCILVPLRDEDGNLLPGVSAGDQGHKGGLLGVDNGTLSFEHVRVPRANLLNRYGSVDANGVYSSPIESPGRRFFTTLSTLVRGRISVGGGASAAARKGLVIASRYALQRTQFTKPDGDPIRLIEYQTHQTKLIPEIAHAYAFGFAQNNLIKRFQEVRDGADEKTSRALESRAAGLKAAQTRWANDTLQICREACGGAGYMSENGITLTRADADIFATFEGDNTVLYQLLGRALVADFQSSWKDLDMWEAARRSAGLVGNRIIERTGAQSTIERLVTIARRSGGPEQLRARGWHIDLLEYREKRVLESLGLRLREVLKQPEEEQFEAFNACQNHLVSAAKAHLDRIILEAFVDAITDVTDDEARQLLIKVCDLHALSVIKKHRAWFLEHGRIDGVRSRAIGSEVENLSAELSEHTEALIEGLGVPETWLNSEIAKA